MTILLVGDLHYDLRQLDWVLGRAADHDLVVLAGDLLDVASAVPLEAQVPVILGYLARLVDRTTTVLCSGNHDLTGRDGNGERSALWIEQAAELGVHVDWSALELEEDLVTICPWWDGPKGKDRVDGLLRQHAAIPKRDWIWVYHWPPPDSPVSWIGDRWYGDADLAKWIDVHHPAMVLSGHVHQAPLLADGSWVARRGVTWIFNAGHEIGPVPCHVVLDLDARRARWTSSLGTDERDLRTDGTSAASTA